MSSDINEFNSVQKREELLERLIEIFHEHGGRLLPIAVPSKEIF